MFYAIFVAGAIGSALEFLKKLESANRQLILPTIIGAILGACFFLGLTVALSYRQNWARIILVVVCTLNVLAGVCVVGIITAMAPARAIFVVLQLVLQAVASVVILLPASSVWFRRVKAR